MASHRVIQDAQVWPPVSRGLACCQRGSQISRALAALQIGRPASLESNLSTDTMFE